MHGHLALTDSTAATPIANQLQRSAATYTFTPSRQPTKNPLTLATIFNCELIAGAHSFFGIWAVQVVPLPRLYPGEEAAY